MNDEFVLAAGGVDVAEGDGAGERSAGCGVAGDLDAVGAQELLGAGDAALAAAGAHAEACDVLQLVDGDEAAVADGLEEGVGGDVFAVADEGRVRSEG